MSQEGSEGPRARSASRCAVQTVRQPFRSCLMSFLKDTPEVLGRLVAEMHARGLPTKDVDGARRDSTGDLPMLRFAVSRGYRLPLRAPGLRVAVLLGSRG